MRGPSARHSAAFQAASRPEAGATSDHRPRRRAVRERRSLAAARTETTAPVEGLRVAAAEEPAPQPLQIGVRQYRLDENLPEPLAAFGFDDEDIGEIGEGRVVGDDPREADLIAAAVEAEDEELSIAFFITANGIPCAQWEWTRKAWISARSRRILSVSISHGSEGAGGQRGRGARRQGCVLA